MTPSAVDTILILMRMPEYYQIADDAPNAIERERMRLLTELLVSDCDFWQSYWLVIAECCWNIWLTEYKAL